MYSLKVKYASIGLIQAVQSMIKDNMLSQYEINTDKYGYTSIDVTTNKIASLRTLVSIIDEEDFTYDPS